MEELEKSKEISSGSGLKPQFNPQIKEDRLVAFLDIMGFKDMVARTLIVLLVIIGHSTYTNLMTRYGGISYFCN